MNKISKLHNGIKNKNAFTLIEVMIGIVIIAISFLALTSLFITTIRANGVNLRSLTAYSLAQEGLELVRNGRDSNWIQNYSWLGVESMNSPLNLSEDNLNVGEFAYYVASMNFDDLANVNPHPGLRIASLGMKGSSEADVLLRNEIKLCSVPNTLLDGSYLVNIFSNVAKKCEETDLIGAKGTIFSRFIKITKIDINKIRVKSTVIWHESWNSENKPSRIELTTELTDWKGGPL